MSTQASLRKSKNVGVSIFMIRHDMATQINNLRQLLELLSIDETGALVVTALRFAEMERETQVAQPTETRLAPLAWEENR